MKKSLFHLLIVVLAISGAIQMAKVSLAASKPSGVYGKVRRIGFPPRSPEEEGPSMGDEYEIPNCTIVVRSIKDGHEVARAKTNSHGNFKITLSPGKYEVEPLDAGSPSQWGVSGGSKEEVTVWSGFYSEARAVFDGGW